MSIDKRVMCYRCLHIYNLLDAKLIKNKRLSHTKDKCCPKCECKVYFSE
ncbi:TPA: hypothetical protein ACS8GQ_003773 [Providencia alcalifaciens]